MSHSDRDLSEGALFTDQYQLSMAQVYHRTGIHERRCRFDYVFRTYPDYGRHQAGYAVFAGLGDLLGWLAETRFTDADIDALADQRGSAGTPTFDGDFLEWLRTDASFDRLEIDAVAEGRIVHPGAPLLSVTGPLAIAQLVETALLNHLNYPTLIATKASRVAESTAGGTVLEFGMRRGPGFAVNAGGRAALVGGADFTSNVALSRSVGLAPKGTHAHSMVQVAIALGAGELGAFRDYARVNPDDCVLLVDTIDTLGSGVPNAITVFEELRRAGHRPAGIRLDSGDLAYLAVESANLLDAAGFEEVPIVLSSDLDELAIWQIRTQIEQEAPRRGLDPDRLLARLVYGVGTRLITSQGHPALDGVYKLSAVADEHGDLHPAVKLSDSPAKTTIPGDKQVWRLYDDRGLATADVIATHGEHLAADVPVHLHHVAQAGVGRTVRPMSVEPLLSPVWRSGHPIGEYDIDSGRQRRRTDLDRLDPGVRRLVDPHRYYVSLTDEMEELRRRTISESTRT